MFFHFRPYIEDSFTCCLLWDNRGRRGCDRMVVGFIATYAISATINVVSSNPPQARCTRYNNM